MEVMTPALLAHALATEPLQKAVYRTILNQGQSNPAAGEKEYLLVRRDSDALFSALCPAEFIMYIICKICFI